MSAPKIRGGSWLSANYEKLALLIVLVLLLASVATLFLILNSKKTMISAAPWERVPAHPASVGEINTGLVASVNDELANPIQIPMERRRLIVGPLRVSCVSKGEPIAYEATNCPFCGAVQPSSKDEDNRDTDGDGMPDWWEKKYGFNSLDPSDAAVDSDGDGFSNLEEFFAKTDPKDPNSKPEAHSKLRVDGPPRIVPFRLRFVSVSKTATSVKYQINVRDLTRTYFVTNGETVEGFRVTDIDDKDPKKPVLILEHGDRLIRLVQNEIFTQESFSAVLVSLIDKKPFRVLKNQTFKLGESEYKVVDITRDAVVIRDTRNARNTTVPQLTEDERMRLRAGDVMLPETRRPGSPTRDVPVGFPLR